MLVHKKGLQKKEYHKWFTKKKKYQKIFLTVQLVYDMITIVADRAISIA